MKRWVAAIAALLVALWVSPALAARDAKQEAAIDVALAAVDASLVATAHDANAAADRGDWENAAREYAEVHRRAPKVVAITRRLGTAEARSGNVTGGVLDCREALSEEHSAENEAALAAALLANKPVLPGDADEAFKHAVTASNLAPDEVFAITTLCEAAFVKRGEDPTLAACSAKLQKMAPNAPSTHLYTAFSLAAREDWDGAERELSAARAAGYDEKTYRELEASLDQQREMRKPPIVFVVIAWTLVSWVGALFVLFVLGMMLGDSADKSRSKIAGAMHRGVLRAAALSFWPSAVIASALIAFAVFEIAWRFVLLTSTPKWAIAVAGAATVYLLLSTARTLWARVPSRELGARVDLDDEPALRKALAGAAKTAGVEIDEVWIAPGAAIEAVWHAGSRALVIGAASLDGLGQKELLALASCALGALADRGSMDRAVIDARCARFEARGFASTANPIWWIVSAHRAFYVRIGSVAAHARESRAEKAAKTKYGASTLASARDHVEDRTEDISERIAAALAEALEGSHERESFYASAEDESAQDDDAKQSAWSLFSDRAAIERDMNERLWTMLHERAGFAFDQTSSASSVARA